MKLIFPKKQHSNSQMCSNSSGSNSLFGKTTEYRKKNWICIEFLSFLTKQDLPYPVRKLRDQSLEKIREPRSSFTSFLL